MIQLALLRGINLGGKNLVPMRELSALFVQAGCRNVQTYIQSGNVIFEAAPTASERIAEKVTDAIAEHFHCRVPIILRTADQLAAVLENNPFLKDALGTDASEDMLHVYFLANRPAPEQIANLDGARSLPDAFVVQGTEIYLRLPDGMGRTKLTNSYFDSKLATTCTARNWRTLKKLRELMS